MTAITSNQAKQQLDEILDLVILDVEPVILCSDRGKTSCFKDKD